MDDIEGFFCQYSPLFLEVTEESCLRDSMGGKWVKCAGKSVGKSVGDDVDSGECTGADNCVVDVKDETEVVVGGGDGIKSL